VTETWKDDAICNQTDPEAFFPDRGHGDVKQLRRVCGNCPVTQECLEYALVNDERIGFWGGTTPMERRKLRRLRRLREAS
jgi:WhiB family redox-sensing transcriptional regulator